MNRVQGRNMYIVDLDLTVHSLGSYDCFAQQCKLAQLSSIWVRLGHGIKLDRNFQLPDLPKIKAALAKAGIGIWGWHVPQCPDPATATSEANLVVKWAADNDLQGVLIDAEQDEPGGNSFFLGTAKEAEVYTSLVRKACDASGRGLALSSHDQPQGKPDFPFATFLAYIADNCPQVYYTKQPAKERLGKSIAGYEPLEVGRNFKDRFKPVGNITIYDDVPLPSLDACIKQTVDFIALMKTNGFGAYSFWTWDEAPVGIWKTFHTTPV